MYRMIRKVKNKIDKLLEKHKSIIYIYPKASKTKSSEYDPYRDEGYIKSGHNPIGLKCYVRYPSGEGLILREIGLTETDAREIWIPEKHLDLLKNAERIVIENEDYSCYSDAVGNRLQIFRKKGIDLIEVLVFRKKR